MLKTLGATWTIVVSALSFIAIVGLIYEVVFVNTTNTINKKVDRQIRRNAKQVKKNLKK